MTTSGKRFRTTGLRKRHGLSGFVRRHSLSITTMIILILWTVLYIYSDPGTHWGSFFGNAIADWSGVLVTVLATKHMYEKGSAESRTPRHEPANRVLCFLD